MPNHDQPGEGASPKLTPADIFVPRDPVQSADKKAAKEEASKLRPPTNAQLARRGLAEYLNRLQQEHSLRVLMAAGIFVICVLWLFFVAFILFLQGIAQGYIFRVSDEVMIAFLATTTINVLGLLATVVRYLFPRNGQDAPPVLAEHAGKKDKRTTAQPSSSVAACHPNDSR